MEQKKMKQPKHLNRKGLRFALIMLAALLITGCGNKIIRGASPMVRMTELSHQDNKITLQVNMRNLNGVDLDVQSIDISFSAQGDLLFAYNGSVDTVIAANGTESWTVEADESQTSRDLLNQLQNGEVKSLPYTLKGVIMSPEDGALRFEYEGHMYPLPGRPGYFR